MPLVTLGLDGQVQYDCISQNGGDACLESKCYAATWFTKNVLNTMLSIGGQLPDFASFSANFGFDSSIEVPKRNIY